MTPDFTEARYRELLVRARESYQFITYPEHASEGRTVLWRHDIDMSPQRARALARIEAEERIRATYFVLVRSDFYNALEGSVVAAIAEIVESGHELGLHFDASFSNRGMVTSESALVGRIAFERDVLEETFGVQVRAVSLHNPTVRDLPEGLAERDEIERMVNASGRSIRERYKYCSDSNGLWRFDRLEDLLKSAQEERLQVLTHPEWWTPEPLSPREKVTRAIEGRAARQHQAYDRLLETAGRPNLR